MSSLAHKESPQYKESPDLKFSVLIIGCGAIAGGYDAQDIAGGNILTHAKAFNAHGGFDLVGCVDLDLKIAQQFADSWHVDKAYDNFEQAMNDRKFDVVSICTTTATHEYYLRTLQKYDVKMIFCEKPITDNLTGALEMGDIYADRMAVNYIRRFDPELRQLAHDIGGGIYGPLHRARAKYNKGLYNNGSHMTDLLYMMIGDYEVKAANTIIYDFWPNDPTISAYLETTQGVGIDLIGTDMREGMVFDLVLDFSQTKIICTDFSHSIIIKPMGKAETYIETDLDRGMFNAVSNIYDHLVGGTELYSKPSNAIKALAMCDKIRHLAGLS